MEVYRVEHTRHKNGPFTNGLYLDFLDEINYELNEKYPRLWGDVTLTHPISGEWVTGMLQDGLINHWFPPSSAFRECLRKHGYKITTYDVHPDDVLHGRSGLQLIFARHRATPIKQEDL